MRVTPFFMPLAFTSMWWTTEESRPSKTASVPVTVIERQAVENGPSVPSDTTPPVTDTTGNSQNTDNTDKSGDQAFPWWGYALIALCGIAVGVGGTAIFAKLKNKEN